MIAIASFIAGVLVSSLAWWLEFCRRKSAELARDAYRAQWQREVEEHHAYLEAMRNGARR